MQSPPQYQPPPPDPGLDILKAQNEQQQTVAIQDRTSAMSARLMQQYGTRVASSGSSNWSPLLAPAVGMNFNGITPGMSPTSGPGSF